MNARQCWTSSSQTQHNATKGKPSLTGRGSGGAPIRSGPGLAAVRRWILPTKRDVARISVHLGTAASPGSSGRRVGRRRGRRGPVFRFFVCSHITVACDAAAKAAQKFARGKQSKARSRETVPPPLPFQQAPDFSLLLRRKRRRLSFGSERALPRGHFSCVGPLSLCDF